MALNSLTFLLWCWKCGHAGVTAGHVPVPVTGLKLLIKNTVPVTVLEIAHPQIALTVGVLATAFGEESILFWKTNVSTAKFFAGSCSSFIWHGGGVVVWHGGSVVIWHKGGIVAWHGGGVVSWHGGGVITWHGGGVVVGH